MLFLRLFALNICISGTAPDIGSTNNMYDLLVNAADNMPVDGNQHGSYLTMKSNQGLVFGAATILSGFAGVFCDQGVSPVPVSTRNPARLTAFAGYWQRVNNNHAPGV